MTTASGTGWELRLGKWQDVLGDVECDALIVDAPYSERTHSGHDGVAEDSNGAVESHHIRNNRERLRLGLATIHRHINYDPWKSAHVAEFVSAFAPRCRGWFVSITDHALVSVWSSALEAAGRYVFTPLPLVETGSRVRLSGDGPSSWTCWVVVARPKSQNFVKWGTLPGAYVDSCERGKPVVGGKPLGLMRAIVRDYTRPGDLICDPCAGGGTTLLAAVTEGRRAIGAEMMPEHFEIARKRLERGHTPPLFVDGGGR